MTRIRQFANDMGITYNKAKSLVEKGKKKKDGGSPILESNMPIKIVEIKKKKKEVEKPKMRPKKDPFRADKTESLNKKFSMDTAKANEKAIKQIKKAMGGLETKMKKKDGGAFPDLSGDGKVTQKDILIGRGVIKKKKRGGTIGNSVKMRLGGVARGGGAAISGTKFKGVY